MTKWVVKGSLSPEGSVSVPGDKSVGHRSIMFAAISDGTTRVTGLPSGEDVCSTMNVFRTLGVKIIPGEGAGEWLQLRTPCAIFMPRGLGVQGQQPAPAIGPLEPARLGAVEIGQFHR